MIRAARIHIGGGGAEELIAGGTVNREGESLYISYGEEDGATIIGVSEDAVTVTRTGESSYTILLTKGNVTTAEMRTGYGSIPLSIETERIEVAESDCEIFVSLKYTLRYGDLGRSDFCLDIRCVLL